MHDKLGDTKYFASTDYNQRLEEQAELLFEAKNNPKEIVVNKIEENQNIDLLINTNDLNGLYQVASKPLTESCFLKLISLQDKDIFIQLARNENITPKIAELLIGTIYLAHKNLLINPNIDKKIKQKLVDTLKENLIYKDLISEYSEQAK